MTHPLDTLIIHKDALISECGLYRYRLRRWWAAVPKRWVLWVMLNPSTADAKIDDPTITRCMRFTYDWGFDGMMVGNLYAFRATDPKVMLAAPDPVGPDNILHLDAMHDLAQLTVAAWGAKADHYHAQDVRARLLAPHYLALTVAGQPKHPLYLPQHLKPVLWR